MWIVLNYGGIEIGYVCGKISMDFQSMVPGFRSNRECISSFV